MKTLISLLVLSATLQAGAAPLNRAQLVKQIQQGLQQKIQEFYPGAAPVKNVTVDFAHQVCEVPSICKARVSASSNESGIRTRVTLKKLAGGIIKIEFNDDINVE